MTSVLNGNRFLYIEPLKEGNCLNVPKDIHLNRYEESLVIKLCNILNYLY